MYHNHNLKNIWSRRLRQSVMSRCRHLSSVGDTVNTASRIESNGEAGKVNISHATYELLKNDSNFIFESRGKIEAKGKGEMEMYFVSVNSFSAQERLLAL